MALGCSDGSIEAEPGERGVGEGDPPPGAAPFWDGGGNRPGAGDGGPGNGNANGDGGPGGDPLKDPRQQFCEGGGAVVKVPGQREVVYETCTGDLAETIFTNALCTCNNAQLAGYLRTRGFDSREGAFVDDDDFGGGAPVGINNAYTIGAGFTDVGGSFSVAGPDGLGFIGYLRVFGDLAIGADALIPGYARVDRDAWLGGNFTSGPLDVGRDLHQGGVVIAIPLDVGRDTLMEPVAVEPPCPCDELLDIAGIVDQLRRTNDNDESGIDVDALRQSVGSVELNLDCGRYYFSEISGIGEIEVNVDGRVAVAVGGPVAAAGSLRFNLGDDAEIDLFIEGDLGLVGAARFGDEARPAATRIYVAGESDIVLVGASAFVGNVYAPRATVTAPGYLRAFGSFFAKDFNVPGYAHIAYDRSITDLDCDDDPDDPPPPPPPLDPDEPPPPDEVPEGYNCDLCGSCFDGLACIASRCEPCVEDQNCCSQQVCEGGRCVQLVR